MKLAAVLVVATFVTSAVLAIPFSSQTSASASFYSENGAYVVKDVLDEDKAIAVAVYDATLNVTGWDVLNVKTLMNHNDTLSMFAAGYLEGYLTHEQTYNTYLNLASMFFEGSLTVPENVREFIDEQEAWMREQIKANSGEYFWRHAGLVLAQYDGLRAGLKARGIEDPYVASVNNLAGDLLDIMPALNPHLRVSWYNLTKSEFLTKVSLAGHCSALVRVTDDFSDIFMGQVAWFTYGAMARIYKHYNFPLREPTTHATMSSFSSYPGMLESLDDFYIMNSKLVMIQTTNPILNSDLYTAVSPKALFAWHRVRIANTIAKSGKEWSDAVKRFNSGTYNNQYMVIDLNLFKKGQPLAPGLLWVIEQIPGYMEGADVTEILRMGYWASYNNPYFPKIASESGIPEAIKKYGVDMSYSLTPRAKIFRRDHAGVTTYENFKLLMRENEYKTDPYSEGSTFNAICSRGDLNSPPSLGGCYDGKVTSFERALLLQSDAINGPTRGANNEYPPFKWLPEFNKTLHYGQPDVYDFEFVQMQPLWK